jgi:amino acid transporter
MTGVEAISNGVPVFREPNVKNARKTLTIIIAILMLMLFGIGTFVDLMESGRLRRTSLVIKVFYRN